MQLTTENIHNIARLARLKVKEENIDALCQDLSHILDWVEQLNELDTKNVEPMSSVNLEAMPMRSDIVTDGKKTQEILQNARLCEANIHSFGVPESQLQ